MGVVPGVYQTWADCQKQVNGYPGAKFKGFATLVEAQTFAGQAQHGQAQQSQQQQLVTQEEEEEAGEKSEDDSSLVLKSNVDPALVISLSLQAGQDVRPLHQVLQTRLYKVMFDGASRGNGSKDSRAGSGAVITDIESGRAVAEVVCPLPAGCTNNEAEYSGLLMGLQACVALGICVGQVAGDSKLCVMQVTGKWAVRAPHLATYVQKAKALMHALTARSPSLQLVHVLREHNQEADRLSNVAVDAELY
eukprot:CAMPEP_0119106374 /NCGR_PEP_ID=MMETSP1180-20130426/4081_1 /TAXON_ID=3052 ORGANISM="Chlamydomonas cf sp, Strain CCMP681" /NCGR_SAMPLE_ID=MMETSP1180 /ASSEMBLY_ACC=CAM_ASM_000741 /LENGTH=248 /DNA_ID=CAMNT_0007091693 /DNA_START=185 /DNA_END=931 /DNA_ORIENTATION=-